MTDERWFLVIYGGLLASLLVATAIVWWWSQPAGDPDLDEHDLTDIELAAINGGPRLAAITAATALRRSHVVHTPDGLLVAHGPLADGTSELERELFEIVRQTPGSPARALVDDAARSATVERIIRRLTGAGLRLDDDAALRLTMLWACASALAAAGTVGVILVLQTDFDAWRSLAPAAALIVATLLLMRWIGKRRAGATAAGRKLIKRVRDDRQLELRAVGGHVVLGVAMFGSAVLWQSDPAFAAALEIPSQTATSVGGFFDAFSTGWDSGGCGGCGCGGCG